MPTPARRFGSYVALFVAACLTTFAVHSAQLLVHTERLVDDIVTNSPVGIVVCSEQGEIEACNVAFEQLVGSRPIGQPVTSLMSPEYREQFTSTYSGVMKLQHTALDSQPVYTHVRPLLRADGTEIPVIIHAVVVRRAGELKAFGFVTRKVE